MPTFCPHYSGFQSTHPSGVRPAAGSPHGSRSYFNPRTPVGCDTPSAIQSFHCLEFQSTHPSGVRRGPNGRGLQRQRISIHAPQWGATRRRARTRATTSNFNPRTPVGCDRVRFLRLLLLVISIHAPQWGATWRWRRNVATPKPFQSTHPSGVRLTLLGMITEPLAFQSTHPSGVRPPDWDKPAYTALFQSTHPSGVRRQSPPSGNQEPEISIHAPQWGATYTSWMYS